MASYDTIVSNELEEVHMIAGDDKDFVYTVYDEDNVLVNLTSASCTVYIFRYGDTDTIVATITGVVTPLPTQGEFTASFSNTLSSGLSGVYQQQLMIEDHLGGIHRPAQGKIVIFPSPSV